MTEYETATTDATNKITATSSIEGATVTIMNGETEVTSGTSATWVAGENTVTITVEADGYETGTYTVIVTKS